MMVDVEGLDIHIERRGTGPPLLLVHGLGSPLVWDRLIDPLSHSFDVIAIDLPGFGNSSLPPTPFSTQQYANFLLYLLDTLQLPRTSILGISYGGQIALTFAFDHQRRIDKLILVASTGLGPKNSFLSSSLVWRLTSFLVKNTILKSTAMIQWCSQFSFFDLTKRPNDFAERFHRALAQPGRKETWLQCAYNVLRADNDVAKRLVTLTIPTLIVWGKEDRILSRQFAEEFHRLLSNSSVSIVEKCGHSLPLEKPNELVEEIKLFG